MASNVVVLWLVGAELKLVVAEVADGSHEVLGVLAVAGVLGQKKLALDRNIVVMGETITDQQYANILLASLPLCYDM